MWTFHAGQICTAPTRAIVHRSRYQEFVEGLAKMATLLPVGRQPTRPYNASAEERAALGDTGTYGKF